MVNSYSTKLALELLQSSVSAILIRTDTQLALSRSDLKIVDRDVKPQKHTRNIFHDLFFTGYAVDPTVDSQTGSQ